MGVLQKLEQLNPECFIWEKWESNWWNVFNVTFKDSLDICVMKKCIDTYSVGYCEGSRTIVRPNLNSYAVMFEKDGDRFWFHVEKNIFEYEV